MSERTQQTAVVVALVAVVAAVGAVSWLGGRMADPAGPPVASVEEVVEPSVEPTASPSSSVSASASEAEPSESPSAAESEAESEEAVAAVPEGQTVLFRGGPADGPWRGIGSVTEITHPDAAPGAAYGYTNFWSDPEEENQPDWLWDQITAEVAAQAVELGEPVDRPAFGGAELSEAFNAFGGVEDIYPGQGVYTALWSATYQPEEGSPATTAHWGYVVSFEGEIRASFGPFLVAEGEVEDAMARGEAAVEWLRRSASEEGYTCEVC